MAASSGNILSVEDETKLIQPIDEHVSNIQKKIDELRAEGTSRVVSLQSSIDIAKNDHVLTKTEREQAIAGYKAEMEQAKKVEAANKPEVDKLISEAEAYLKEHYDAEYLTPVKESCAVAKTQAKIDYEKALKQLKESHDKTISFMQDQREKREENYIYKNKQFDAKITYQNQLQAIKDREHEAFTYRYHLIDMLRMGKFTFAEKQAQKRENYLYTFNTRDFFLKNGLYIVILLVFIALCVAAPVVKNTHLLTIFGIRTRAAGRVYFRDRLMNFSNAREAMDHGFALITEERKANGLFLKGDLTFNTTIANLNQYKSSNGLTLSNDKMVRATNNEIKTMRTKCMGPDDLISSLSGGNQQKVIFGKWLERGPQVFMMDEPTRGIDVGAKYEIYELIIKMAKQGKTIIVVSSEMPEILGITNRIGVMSNGRLSGIVKTSETNQEELLRLSAKYL